MKKVILVTGASSGLGLATASALAAQGHTVYGTSRDVKRIKDVSFNPLQMDVTDDTSVNAAVEKIIKAEGKIDVLVTMPVTALQARYMPCPLSLLKSNLRLTFLV